MRFHHTNTRLIKTDTLHYLFHADRNNENAISYSQNIEPRTNRRRCFFLPPMKLRGHPRMLKRS